MATVKYLNSSDISVFPATRRDDSYDRASRLPTEQNLISIVNRVVGLDSFIVSGLTISGNAIQAGSCNIHGYLFNIKNSIDISSERNNYLYFKIAVKLDPVTNFEELYSIDVQESLDVSEKFHGLGVISSSSKNLTVEKDNTNNIMYYYLLIAIKEDSVWKQPETSKLVFDASQIGVNIDNSIQTLGTYLNTLVIDDGEI